MSLSGYITVLGVECRTIGDNIRRIRKEAGLSVDELLAREWIPISRPYWYQIENGVCNASITNLVVVAEALGVTLRDLLEAPKPKRERRAPDSGWPSPRAVRN